MIQADILRAVLLDQNENANVCCDIYGSKKIINILAKTKLRNNFLNLWSNHKKNIFINLRKNNKDFIIKKLHTKNISEKLSEHGVKHVFIKGVPLSNSFYKNYSDRVYTDADILIDVKDYKKFYEFLDANNLKHNFNYRYINRIGFTRSALEVIDSEINLDFHFRISENFKKNECKLSRSALSNHLISDGLPIPHNEFLLTICLFNALKKDQLRSGPIYLVDMQRIMDKGINEDRLLKVLKEHNLTKFYEDSISIINNLKGRIETKKQSNFIYSLFKNEGKKGLVPSKNVIFTQIMHFIDPEPYINCVGGNLQNNHYLELFKNKFKRIQKRI